MHADWPPVTAHTADVYNTQRLAISQIGNNKKGFKQEYDNLAKNPATSLISHDKGNFDPDWLFIYGRQIR